MRLFWISVAAALASSVLVQSQFTRVIPDQAFPGRSVSMVLSNATHVTLLGGTTSGTPDVDGLQAVPVVFDVVRQSLAPSSSALTAPRIDAAMTVLPPDVAAVLGCTAFSVFGINPATKLVTRDLYCLSRTTNTWVAWTLGSVTGLYPYARRGANAVYLRECGQATGEGCLVTMGGNAGGTLGTEVGYTNLIWVHRASPVWDISKFTGTGPGGRYGHAMGVGPDQKSVFIFGGYRTLSPPVVNSDVWWYTTSGFIDDDAPATHFETLAVSAIGSSSRTTASGAQATITDGLTTATTSACLQTVNNTANPYARVGFTTPVLIHRVQLWFLNSATALGFEVWASNTSAVGSYNSAGAIKLPNPYTEPVLRPTTLTLTTPVFAQYVWVVIPGSNRELGLCEIAVLRARPFRWRTLSGYENVALNKWASQAAMDDLNNFGPPANAVNGITSGETTRTLWRSDKLWWRVDLGRVYNVRDVRIWDGAVGYSSANIRANNTEVVLSLNADPWAPTQQACWYGTIESWAGASVPNCNGDARYVIVRKPPTATGDDRIIMLTELQVWARTLLNEPSERFGMAYSQIGSTLVIVGGQDANGFLLSEVRRYDMLTRTWLPMAVPLGTAPAPRVWGTLVLLPTGDPLRLPVDAAYQASNTMLLFGGQGITDPLSDATLLEFPACPILRTPAMATSLCELQGTSCTYTCMTGLFDPNGPQNTAVGPIPLAFCGTNGEWSGAAQPVCAPKSAALPGKPQWSAAPLWNPSAGVNGGVTLAWIPPTPIPFGNSVTQYRVKAAFEGWEERFTSSGTALPSGWSFVSGAATNTWSIVPVGIALDAAPLADCTFGAQNCPLLLRSFPTPPATGAWPSLSVSGAWSLEAQVSFDYDTTKSPKCENAIGIGIYDTSKTTNTLSLASTGGALEFVTGLHQYCGSNNYGDANHFWQANNYASGFASATYLSQTNGYIASPNVYIRIDRDPPPSGGAAGVGRWRFGYRYDERAVWTFASWQSDTVMLRTQNATNPLRQFNPATAKIALFARSQSTNRAYGRVHFLRWRPLDCSVAGPTRVLPASTTSTTVTGLSPGARYTFTVEADAGYGFGAASDPSPIVSVPSTSSAGTLQIQGSQLALPLRNQSRLLEVALNKPTAFNGATDYSVGSVIFPVVPSMGNDGVICVGLPSASCGNLVMTSRLDSGPWWRVDLGIPTSVKEIALWNRDDVSPQRLDNVQVFVGNSPLRSAMNGQCTPSQVPATIRDTQLYNGYTFAARFNCSFPTGLVGRYVMLVGATGLYLSFREMQVFAAQTCVVERTLPAYAQQVPGTNCGAGAPIGSVCVHQCQNGFIAVAGTGTSTCTGEVWTGPGLVCQPTCATLPAPANVAGCEQSLFRDNFDDENSTLASWVNIKEAVPTLGSSAFIADGRLQIGNLPGCAMDGEVLVVSSERLSNWRGDITISALVSTSDRAGVVFRATDAGSFYRVYIDIIRSVVVMQRVTGVTSTLVTDADVTLVAGVPVNIEVSSKADGTVTVSLDGDVAMTTVEAALSSGTCGVWASTAAQFQAFEVVTPCTGGCADATDGNLCTFTCAAGLKPVWSPSIPSSAITTATSATRTCSMTGGVAAWDPVAPPTSNSYDLACTLDPPFFPAATLRVAENSARNAVVGDPLVATIDSPDYSISFAITSGNTDNAFWIDSCTGQVKVRNAVLNYEARNNYTLMVTASVAGIVGADTTTAIIVQLIDVDEAPVITDFSINLAENSAAGVFVGRVTPVDPEGNPALLSLDVDGSSGVFTLNSTSGDILVSAAGGVIGALDYETNPGPFVLVVRATQIGSPSLSGVGKVTILLTDANDAPIVTLARGQSLLIDQSDWASCVTAGLPCALPGLTVPAIDQDRGSFPSTITYSVVAPGSQAGDAGCSANGALLPPFTYPTSTLALGGSALFTVNSATGAISLATATSTAIGALTPFAYNGNILRALLSLCVRVSDSSGANTTAAVPISVRAASVTVPVVYGAVVSTVDGLLPTAGGATITFNCSSCGATGSGSVRAIMTGPSGRMINATNCSVVVADASVVCASPQGSGAGYSVNLQADIGGSGYRDALAQTPIFVSYRLPVITAISGATNVPTRGGTTLVLNGTDLSPQAAADAVSVTLGEGAQAAACAIIRSSAPHTSVMCAVPNGAGANVLWTLSVGGQVITSADPQRVKYAPPTITSIAADTTVVPVANLNALSTVGNEKVVITGTNFGPTTALLAAGYGDLAFTSCTRRGTAIHEILDCVTAPGVGAGKLLSVTVVDQAAAINPNSSSFVLSYAAPVVTAVSGPGALGADTQGGQEIVITGSNFGPRVYQSTVIDSVSYGKLNSTSWRPWYQATACRIVDAAGTKISCLSAPGSGSGHVLRVSIGGQQSPIFNAGIRYGAPVVYSFSGDGAADAATAGFQAVSIAGRNFGPRDGYEDITVRYGTKLDDGPVSQVTFQPASCALSGSGHSGLDCVTGPGAGKNLVWSVVVDGLQSVQPTTAYAVPAIAGISLVDLMGTPVPFANVNGNSTAIITGTNFGPANYNNSGKCLVQSVLYGPSGTEYAAPASGITCVDDSTLRVRLPSGAGSDLKMTVAVADQMSAASTATFSFSRPVVVRVYPSVVSTYSDPRKPTGITVVTNSVPYSDPGIRVRILFGNGAFSQLISPVVPAGPLALAAATEASTGFVNISFSLPTNGAGAQQGVQLQLMATSGSMAGMVVAASDVSMYTAVSYADPVVTDVIVTRARFSSGSAGNATSNTDEVPCPFAANDAAWDCNNINMLQVTLMGSNFGAAAEALMQPDGVTRSIDMLLSNRTLGGAIWGADPIKLYSWSHTKIIAYTFDEAATVRISLASFLIDGSAAVQTAIASYVRASPEIGALTGARINIPTTGGSASDPLILEVYHLQVGSDAEVTVGGRPASVLLADAACPSGTCTSVADLITHQLQIGNTGVIYLKVVVPAGQGVDQAVQLTRIDGSSRERSNTGFTVSYAPPALTSIDVYSVTGQLQSSIDPNVDNAKVIVPTDGVSAVIRVRGTNLGPSPTVILADGYTLTWTSDTIASAVRPCGGAGDPAPALHRCWELTPPEGDGDGRQYPDAYPTGYKFTFAAGNQDADAVKFRYADPAPAGVVTSSGGEIPTTGNVPISIVGSNFGARAAGRPDSSISVTFSRSGSVSDVQTCINPVRISHWMINCTLPEGSGKGLDITVAVNGLVGTGAQLLDYSKPEIFNITVFNDTALLPGTEIASTTSASFTYPVIHGAAAGGNVMVISGKNFGTYLPAHCLFLSWSNRRSDASLVRTCNDREDWLGEGEVSHDNVISWDHTGIVIRTPPGLGVKDVELSIRGRETGAVQGSAAVRRFEYSAPTLVSMRSFAAQLSGSDLPVFDTEGGEVVTLTGSGFGPTPRNTTNPSLQLQSDVFSTQNVSLADAPAMPTAFVTVVWNKACITAARTIFGAKPQASFTIGSIAHTLEDCDSTIFSQQENRIRFASGAGIGQNKTAYVIVMDGPTVIVSNPVRFSYHAPEIDSFAPTTVYMAPADASTTSEVDVLGSYFGNAELATAQGWSSEEREMSMVIGGNNQSCDVVRRRRESNGNGHAETIVTCVMREAVMAVGYQDVSLAIAGQVGFQPHSLGSRSLLLVCAPGFYGHVNETCLPCPALAGAGAKCDGYLRGLTDFESRFSYPRPQPGFYNLNSSDRYSVQWGGSPISACPDGWQDHGRDVCIVPCDPPESCLGDNICEFGYTSKAPNFRCAYCDKGFYKRAGECIKCPDSPAGLFIGFAFLVVIVAGVGFMLNKKQVNIAVISIGIDFFQVLAIFSQSRVKWPPVIKELLHVLSAFNLNIEIVAPECLIPDVSYQQKFWFIMLLPLSVGFLLLTTFLVLVFNKAVIKGREKKRWFSHSPTLVSSSLVLIYMLYLYLTRTILDVFNCTPTMPPDGYTYLSVVFERCGVAGGTQLTLLPFAIAGLVVYTFGYPAFIGYTLYKNRELVMEDQLLRAKGVGFDRLSNPRAYNLRKMFGRAYFQFKPDCCTWIVMIVLRKFFIALTAVIFNKNSSFQMAACLLVMFIAYSLQMMARPYMSPGDYEEVLDSHAKSSYTSAIHARLRTNLANTETRGRKKLRKNLLNFEGKVDRSAVLGILTGWLFNYNTVEQIMIFAAVIVCLMGIMYQANEVNTYYPESKDSVTAVVLAVIILAILYFVTVLSTEIYVLYNEERNVAMLAKKSAGRKSVGGKDPSVHDGSVHGGKGKLVGEDGEINVGKMDTQMNPLFMNAGGNGANAVAGDSIGLEAIMAQRTSPPPELWSLFQHSFGSMAAQVTALQEQLAESKKREALGGSRGSAEVEDVSPMSARKVAAKTSFAPKSAGNDGGSGETGNPMARGASKNMMKLSSVRRTNSKASAHE